MIKKIPHTCIIIFYLFLITAAITWVIPGGKYTTEPVITPTVTMKLDGF